MRLALLVALGLLATVTVASAAPLPGNPVQPCGDGEIGVLLNGGSGGGMCCKPDHSPFALLKRKQACRIH